MQGAMPYGMNPGNPGWPGAAQPQVWNPALQPVIATPRTLQANLMAAPPPPPQKRLTLPPPPGFPSHEQTLPGLASAPAPTRVALPSPAALGIKLDTPGSP
jgi:hypothetical protein